MVDKITIVRIHVSTRNLLKRVAGEHGETYEDKILKLLGIYNNVIRKNND